MKILIISLLSVATFLSNAQTQLIDSLHIEVNTYEQRSCAALYDDTILNQSCCQQNPEGSDVFRLHLVPLLVVALHCFELFWSE